MKPWVIAMTGASGAAYGMRLIQVLLEAGQSVIMVLSEPARLVIREELEVQPQGFQRPQDFVPVFGKDAVKKLEIFSPKDFTAPIASGSFPVEGMVVVPMSMGTLGAIAHGLSQNLIHRAADCMLKEGRKLILVPRETPMSAIHLENLLKLAKLGVRIVPAMPGFYAGAKSIHQMIDFLVGKILDQMGIENVLYPRWTGLLKQHSKTVSL